MILNHLMSTSRLTSTMTGVVAGIIAGMMTIMMMVIPAQMMTMTVGTAPRIIPHRAMVCPPIMAAPMIAVGVSPMEGEAIRGSRHIVPIVSVAPRRKHIGIHTIIIYVPVPAGPQGATIHHVPIERAAHRDGIARITETDDAHGILIVRVAAIEAVHPSLIILHASQAQGIGIHPHRVALLGDEHETLITHGICRHGIALLGKVRSAAVIGIFVYLSQLDRSCCHGQGFNLHLLVIRFHRLFCHLFFRDFFLLGNKIQVVALRPGRTHDSAQQA